MTEATKEIGLHAKASRLRLQAMHAGVELCLTFVRTFETQVRLGDRGDAVRVLQQAVRGFEQISQMARHESDLVRENEILRKLKKLGRRLQQAGRQLDDRANGEPPSKVGNAYDEYVGSLQQYVAEADKTSTLLGAVEEMPLNQEGYQQLLRQRLVENEAHQKHQHAREKIFQLVSSSCKSFGG